LVKYVLEIGKRMFLAWFDEDTVVMVLSPPELWDLDNLLEALDDPLMVLSYREIDIASFGKRAGKTFATHPLPTLKAL
jgi:hypothetical protein